MKKLISTLVIAAAISSPVFAEKGHEHGDSKDQPMGGMMMGHEQMMAMHEHMQKMHDMMGKIKAETDPEKRQQLMQEHMRVMQKGMRLMGDGMGMEMTVGESSNGRHGYDKAHGHDGRTNGHDADDDGANDGS